MAVRQAKSAFGTDTGTTEANHGTLPTTPGSYSGAIVAGDLNQNISRQVDDASTFLIRFLIQCDANSASSNAAPQFEYNKNSAGWVSITTTSANIKAVATNTFANAAPTTLRMGGTGTTDTSNAGCTTDGLAGGATMDIPTNGQMETICGVQLVPADLAAGNTLDLRISAAGITVYDFTPRITITAAPQINSGDGTAAGAGAVAGGAASWVAGTGTTAGTGDAAAVGEAVSGQINEGDGIATGVGDAAGVGAAVGGGQINAGEGTAASTGAAVGAGAVIKVYLPNVVLAGTTNLQDTSFNSPPTDLTDIQDDPAAPDADWYTAVNPAADTMLHLGFSSPEGNLISGQNYPIRVRKTAGAGNPTVTVALYENGVFVANLVGPQAVTAGAPDGEEILVPWDASLLSDPSGVNAEIRIIGTAV